MKFLKLKKLFAYLLVLATVLVCYCNNGRNILCYFGYGSTGEYGERIPELSIADDADTVFVVVKNAGYTSCKFYAYANYFGRWVEEFTTIGYLGTNGVIADATQRRAGTRKTPGGVYSLGEKFGIKDKPKGLKAEYIKVNEDHYWSGDSRFPTYNQLVKGSEMPPEWSPAGSEHLIDYVGVYNYCTMINFNVNPKVPGRGAAIFLHCTSDTATSSAGCVAIPEEKMIESLILMGSGNSYIVILEHPADFDKYLNAFGTA